MFTKGRIHGTASVIQSGSHSAKKLRIPITCTVSTEHTNIYQFKLQMSGQVKLYFTQWTLKINETQYSDF